MKKPLKDQLKKNTEKSEKIRLESKAHSDEQNSTTTELKKLEKETAEIALQLDLNIPEELKTNDNTDLIRKWDNDFFIKCNPFLSNREIRDEIYKNPDLLPEFTDLDWAITGLAGGIAVLVDFLVVRIPDDINYLKKHEQEGSEFTKWLKSLGLDEDGKLNGFFSWFEENGKVPYDQSVNNSTTEIKGFSPKTHRLLNLSHDPLFGMIFGLIDILNGSMTTIDINGNIQIHKTLSTSATDKVFAPFIWLGHIISDMCTKMGIPVPGWAFTQLLQFGEFGDKNRTVAEISKWMYLNGYDLRHFLTMSIPVAVIEIIIRAYHYLTLPKDAGALDPKRISITSKELHELSSNLKLQKMLFLAHTFSASGNALKVFSYSGNPLAINTPVWIMFFKNSIQTVKAISREKEVEMIARNREKINSVWSELLIDKTTPNISNVDSNLFYDYLNKT